MRKIIKAKNGLLYLLLMPILFLPLIELFTYDGFVKKHLQMGLDNYIYLGFMLTIIVSLHLGKSLTNNLGKIYCMFQYGLKHMAVSEIPFVVQNILHSDNLFSRIFHSDLVSLTDPGANPKGEGMYQLMLSIISSPPFFRSGMLISAA